MWILDQLNRLRGQGTGTECGVPHALSSSWLIAFRNAMSSASTSTHACTQIRGRSTQQAILHFYVNLMGYDG